MGLRHELTVTTTVEGGTAGSQRTGGPELRTLLEGARQAQRSGDLDRAAGLHLRVVRVAVRSGDRRLLAMGEQNLGVLARIRGDLDAALVHNRTALRIFRELREAAGLCGVLNNLAALLVRMGSVERARHVLGEALAHREELDDPRTADLLELNRARVEEGGHEPEERVEVVIRRARERDDRETLAEGLRVRAELQRASGEEADARASVEEALALTEDGFLEGELLRERGDLLENAGRPDEARECRERARQRFQTLGAALELADLDRRPLEEERA